ncbi:sugar isomerase domain-containing protein [Labrys neptuniae]
MTETVTTAIPTAAAYLADLTRRIADLMAVNGEAIAKAVAAVERTAEQDGLVYVFGTGHSHMLAEEAHYRAGGLAFTVPILSGVTMLHEGAVAGTSHERIPGIVGPLLARYPIGASDMLIIASNSGVNTAVIEAAGIGKAAGATVAAVTSVAYSSEAAKGRPRLADVADIVLDNGAPPGDASVALPDSDMRAGPVSTSIGAALLNAVFAEAAARLQAKGGNAPVYRSANMPGAAEINAGLIARYRPRNPHL